MTSVWVSGARRLARAIGLSTAIGASALGQDERGAAPAGDERRPGELLADRYARRHVLAIGVNDYADAGVKDLANAEADATAVAELLVARFGFERRELLLGAQANQRGICRALRTWLASPEIGVDDLVVVYFGGHGEVRTIRGDERRLATHYLVPQDAELEADGSTAGGPRSYAAETLVQMAELRDATKYCIAKHVVLLVDCCFGGALVTERSNPISEPYLRSRAREILTAGLDGEQPVLDADILVKGHSPFAAAILEALDGAGDRDRNGQITMHELESAVREYVYGRTARRQNPAYATDGASGHAGGGALFMPAEGRFVPNETKEQELARVGKELAAMRTTWIDVTLVRELLATDLSRWPARRSAEPAMRAWLATSDRVLANRATHERAAWLVEERARLQEGSPAPAGASQVASRPAIDWAAQPLEQRFEHDSIVELLALTDRLRALRSEVVERLAAVEEVEQQSITDAAAEWSEVIGALAEDARFAGFELPETVGLVPLRPDPASGLWEFWACETGAEPLLDAATGRCTNPDDAGAVMVLVPGGSFLMGASDAIAPDQPGFDPNHIVDAMLPLHRVELRPFFISKFELTQGQWRRMTGTNPAFHATGVVDGRHRRGARSTYGDDDPVESVSWNDCVVALRRFGMRLPTEAQWECAARAGTTTPWWTGADFAATAAAGNLFDRTAVAWFGASRGEDAADLPDWSDPFADIAPVGRFAPNPWGLHDVVGNVFEWCEDAWDPRAHRWPVRPRDGRRVRESPVDAAISVSRPTTTQHVLRGGSYDTSPFIARSTFRVPFDEDGRLENIGVRPVVVPGDSAE